MPPTAESSTAYRDRRVDDDDDDDDLDDLDDVLASFNKPRAAVPKAEAVSPPPQSGSTTLGATASSAQDNEEDFEASLVEGMESLLRQLAGDNPPGPMPGSTSTAKNDRSTGSSALPDANGRSQPPLSAEEEEKAFQRAIEMMLSKEGLDALGLDEGGDRKPPLSPSAVKQEHPSSSSSMSKSKSGSKSQPNRPEVTSFEETIKKAMESLNTAGDKKPGSEGGAGGSSDPADLARLLAQLGNDPNLDLEGDDELSGILDGMMGQLMTREVLEEPMSELASKYPDYLASPPAETSAADVEKYRQQYAIVQKIVDTFRKPGYSDDKDGKEIAKLVGEMQDLGGPPQEIMGDLPEGFDLGALAGDESCTIM